MQPDELWLFVKHYSEALGVDAGLKRKDLLAAVQKMKSEMLADDAFEGRVKPEIYLATVMNS